MSITPEHNELSSLEPGSNPVKKRAFNQQQLEQIKQQLLRCIDSIAQSSSWITQLSLWWGSLSWWLKITAAAVIMLPLLLIGLAAQIVILSAIGCCLLGFSALTIAVMENHQQHQINHIQEIKTTILSLTDLLAAIILNIEASSNQLAAEIDHVHKANQRLTEQCTELEEEIIRLNSSNQHLEQNQHQLLEVQKKLQTTISTIDSTVIEQTALLQKSQVVLAETTAEYKKNQLQLAATVTELNEVKEVLSLEIYKAQRITETLNKVVTLLSTTTLEDQQQRELFFTKLNAFINNQQRHFDAFAKNLVESGQHLSQAVHDIKANSSRFSSLLDKQEQQVNRLSQVKPSKAPAKIAAALQQHGLYAADSAIETLNTTMLTLAVH